MQRLGEMYGGDLGGLFLGNDLHAGGGAIVQLVSLLEVGKIGEE